MEFKELRGKKLRKSENHSINQVGNDLWDHQINQYWTPPCQPGHGTQWHIQYFLKHVQGLWLHCLSGQPVPMPNQLFCEEILRNVQPKCPLGQLRTVSSCLSLVFWENWLTSTLLSLPFWKPERVIRSTLNFLFSRLNIPSSLRHF